MIDIDGYLLTKSINHKSLVKVRPFTAAKTIDIYDHLKPTLRDSILTYLSYMLALTTFP